MSSFKQELMLITPSQNPYFKVQMGVDTDQALKLTVSIRNLMLTTIKTNIFI